jgi:hypothetical protein
VAPRSERRLQSPPDEPFPPGPGPDPELAVALAAGERPEPRVGDFRAGVVMTRFFSHLCLTANGDGTLEQLAQEPVASEPVE